MTKKIITDKITHILNSIQIIDSTHYSFFDDRFQFNSHMQYENQIDENSNFVDLKDLIYSVYHCNQDISSIVSSTPDEQFVGLLSECNTGQGTWDFGWQIIENDCDEIVVEKDGLRLWSDVDQFFKYDSDQNYGYLSLPKEFRALSPGFYTANGNSPIAISSCLVKLYWNISAAYAPSLMKKITESLNLRSLPFQLKILNNPDSFPRNDAAVLYMDVNDFIESKHDLSLVYNDLKQHLNSSTSLFVKQIGNGLGLAEEIYDDEGFGQRLSRILAEGIFSISSKKLKTNNKISNLVKYFKKYNIDLYRPYLNSNSTNDYDLILKGVFD